MTPQRLIEPARLAGSKLLRTQSDERLVDLTRDGNDRAFEAIVQRYRRPLLRYCTRMLPATRAEDAVQQAFLSAYTAIRSGDAELNLKPWLYRIAHNATLNALRQNGWTHEQLDETIDGVERPDQALERRQRLGEVILAVQALPDRQRDAIVLRELEGRSYEEIASTLDVTDGAVRQLLNRARTALRAAAAAFVPPDLVARLAVRGAPADSIGARVAEICAGAGGATVVAKLGTAVVVAGALAGGAAQAPVPGLPGASETARATPVVAAASAATGSPSGVTMLLPARSNGRGSRSLVGDGGDRGRRQERKSSGHGDDSGGGGTDDGGRGDRASERTDDSSAHGGGAGLQTGDRDDSDSGSSGSSGDSSGSGGSDDSPDPVVAEPTSAIDDDASSDSGTSSSSGSGSSGGSDDPSPTSVQSRDVD